MLQKVYSRTHFKNRPSTDTPLDEINLNKVDYALDQVDNRVIDLDTTKANQTVVNTTFTSVELDEKTGIFTFRRIDGSVQQLDTLLEKVAVNFDFDEERQKLIIYLEDGTKKEVDLSAFIKAIEFVDSETIIWELLPEGKVKAKVREGSINESHLRPEYLADIKVVQAAAQGNQVAAELAETNAKTSESNAKISEIEAKKSEENAANLVDVASKKLADIHLVVESDGHLYYELTNEGIIFRVNAENGHLEFTFV